jgi:glycosyltransferase involved in cell wall biosynthesis
MRRELRALFLIEDMPLILDTRVLRETAALRSAGVASVVICPAEKNEPWHEVMDGVHVYRYRWHAWGESFAAHLLEYVTSLVAQSVLTLLVLLRHGFDVIHVGNPPDLLWLVAAPYKLIGKRFIYDQHDLVPELFEVRFGRRVPLVHAAMLMLERASYRLANHVITTTESFRRLAVERGGRQPRDVTVVRNGPHLSRDFPDVTPDPDVRAMGRIVVGYLGLMNQQDHLELFLQMARCVRFDHGRTDIAFVMVGSGDSFPSLVRLRDELGLSQAVRMTGTLPWKDVLATLNATDICVQPDPPNVFNRHLAMNKLMEYMALGKASVAFDMLETRVTGADAVLYVSGSSPENLAAAVVALADDPARRAALGATGRRRVEGELSWELQSRSLLAVYRRVFPVKLGDSAVGDEGSRERTDPVELG